MIYDNLNIGMQNAILYNFEASTKFFIIMLFLFVSMLYLFYIRKGFKDTENPIIAVFRVVAWVISYMFIYSFPLMYIFYLAPGYSFNVLIMLLLKIYSIGFIVLTLYGVTKYAVIFPLALLKVGKLNPEKFKRTILKELNLK